MSQQTPSAQCPDRHAASDLHGTPSGRTAVQLPCMQVPPAAQSTPDAQLVRHAPMPQVYGRHRGSLAPAVTALHVPVAQVRQGP